MARRTARPNSTRRRRGKGNERLPRLIAWCSASAAAAGEHAAELATRGFDRLLPPESIRRRRAELLGTGLFAAVLLCGAIWGVPALVRQADGLSREAAVPESGPRVVFAGDLEWLPDAERERLAATICAELAGRSVVDHDALAAAADALAATGWFAGTPRVRRTARHLVEVDAPWRIAAALVRDGDADHLVDAEGRRLPLSWARDTGPTGLVVVDGLAEGAPDLPGQRWPGGTLAIALRVLPSLLGHEWSDQIAVLDASDVARGGPIAIETVRGGRLVWGRPDAGAAEVPVATRIAWLDALHAGNGSIDPPPARQFDLRLDYLASAPRRVAVR